MLATRTLACAMVLTSWGASAAATDAPIDRTTGFSWFEAQPTDSSPRDSNRPPAPPPEAYSACNGHSEGDACTVQFRDKTLDGTCRKLPNDETALICVPAHMPQPPGH